MWIDPSTMVERVMRTLVWAPFRAYSSLVSNHSLINNKIEWIRVVADTNGGDKNNNKKIRQKSRLIWSFLQRNWVPCLTQTRRHMNSHSLTCTHTCTHVHSFWDMTVVKHEAWILVNQSTRQAERQPGSVFFFASLISLFPGSYAIGWFHPETSLWWLNILKNDIIAC